MAKIENGVFMVDPEVVVECDRHDAQTRYLEQKVRELNNQLVEHKKTHPLCSKEFLEGFVRAVVDRMVERDLLREPKIVPIMRGWADYSVEVAGDIQGNREARYTMNLTADKAQVTLITATGSGVGYRHFKLPNIDMDAIIDGLDCHISVKAREPLESQMNKARGQKVDVDKENDQWIKKDKGLSL